MYNHGSAPSAATYSPRLWDHVDWQADPRLAYGKGLSDGFELGYAQANAELVAALTRALGGPDCTDYRQAVRRHHTILDARARRSAADREGRPTA